MDAVTIANIVVNLRNKLERQKAAVELTQQSIAGFLTFDFDDSPSSKTRDTPKGGSGKS